MNNPPFEDFGDASPRDKVCLLFYSNSGTLFSRSIVDKNLLAVKRGDRQWNIKYNGYQWNSFARFSGIKREVTSNSSEQKNKVSLHVLSS